MSPPSERSSEREQREAQRKSAQDRPPRRVLLLGSTGSIGRSTLEVIEHLQKIGERFEVVGLAAGGRADSAFAQAVRFGVADVALSGSGDDGVRGLSPPPGVRVQRGHDAALRLVERVAQPGDLVIGAIVGAAGLPATIAAIERGCDIALANKETLVAAGSLVMPMARRRGVSILPVDSEHSAIFQCLLARTASGRGAADSAAKPLEDAREGVLHDAAKEVRRLVVTASGGPFRTWSAERMRQASPDEALRHPTWSMGPKVTIDSASLMNKALEMIEAFWLFDVPAERIEPIIHPQSIVHSFVEFIDGSTIAQLSPPDMKLPIQYALTYPRRLKGCSPELNWSALRSLDFESVDDEKWLAPGLARRAMSEGGTAGAILNAANEVAVAAFLAGRIAFGRIVELVRDTMDAVATAPVRSLEDVHCADAKARAEAELLLGAAATQSG